nr:hypothetical protein [Tanacetum cinerariifolium]
METTIEQQVALDEALVPSAQRLRIGRSNFRLPSNIQSKESTLQVVYDVLRQSPFFKAFLVTADVPEIYMQEFWATATVHQYSIRFKMDTRKHIVDLDSFREMLHISPRVPGQSFAELPFEEEILEFLRFLGHSSQIKTLTDVNVNKLYQPWRSFAAVINKCLTGKSTGFDSLRLSQATKTKGECQKKRGGSASSTTPPTPIATPTPTTTVVAAPRLTAAAKGKQPARATSPTDPSDVEQTKSEQLKIVLKRSRNEMHISQQGGFGTNEGTGSKPGVPDVPSDDSEEELSWNSFDDEDVNDNDNDEEEVPKIDEQETTESGEGANEETESDEESKDEETTEKEEESFDLIPRTPEESEDDGNDEEDQGLRISEEEMMQEEEEADELYRDSSSTSSFVTNLLNPIIDPDRVKFLEDNFSNIPGIVNQYMHQQMPEAIREAVQTQTDRLQDSIQRETDEFLKTIDDNMKKIIKEQVKTQVKAQVTRIFPRIEESVNAQLEAEVLTRLSHSSRTSYDVAADISEMELKKILIDKMEGNKSIQRSDEQRNLYKALVEAYDADKTILDSYGESTILKRRREDDDDQEGPSAGSDRGPKRRREGGEHASASTPSEPATGSAGMSTTGSQSRQLSASESVFEEEPVQTTCQMEEPSHSPLPLIPNNRGRRVISFEHFINNDLGYLWGDIQSKESTLQVVYDVLRQSPFFKAFLVTADVPEFYMQEFWATTTIHQHSIRFKMDTRKHILDLEAFREMLHISLRIPGQSFAELPFKEEIMKFLRGLGHSAQIKTLTYVNVVSRHQNTQQYDVILPIELTIEDIRNTKAYKEYYACATREVAPKPKASARKKKGGSASSTTSPTPIATPTPTTTIVAASRLSAIAKGKQPTIATSPTDPSDVEWTEAEQLKIVIKRSRHETHISQQGGSGKDDDEEEISKIGEQEATESDEGDEEATKSDRENEDEKTREQEKEIFYPIPQTPEDSEDDENNEEDQGLRIGEEERMQEEEEADELYRDVDINQGRGLQVSQDIEDSHVTLTLTHSDGQQESSSTSSFMTNLLNHIIDPADLSEMELKKILIDKMKGNKSIQSTTGSQSRQLSASESAFVEEPVHTTCQMEEPSRPMFETGAEDQPIIQTTQHPEWFSQLRRPPTLDRDWNITLPTAQGNAQSWISILAKQTDARSSFNELLDTPIDFSNFIM